MPVNWTKLEGQIVNGKFPLRAILAISDHSGVFLTEDKTHDVPGVAIKLMQADPAGIQTRLPYWRRGATLSHPNLVRLLDVGRCRLGNDVFDFVVMEHSEQTLAQILPRRALSTEEVEELLPAVRDALDYLHRQNLAHGGIKTSNVLVVNDRIKLSSDNVRPMTGPADDMRELGLTLVEALTQRPAEWSTDKPDTAVLPASVSASLADFIQLCLRGGAAESEVTAGSVAGAKVKAEAAVAPVAPVAAARPAAEPATFADNSVYEEPPQRAWVVPLLVAIVVVAAGWFGVRHYAGRPHTLPSHASAPAAAPNDEPTTLSAPPASGAAPEPAAPEPATPDVTGPPPASTASTSAPAPTTQASPASTPPADSAAQLPASQVLHQESPDIAAHIRDNIRGHIRVSIRVSVDPTGKVTHSLVDTAGPSRFFARKAQESATKWTFVPAEQNTRHWELWFEFSRSGVTANAVGPR